MSWRNFLLSCVIATVGASLSFAWPSGAPEGACESLTPSHGSNRAKHYSSSPFTITQSYSDFQPGDKIKVMVRGPQGTSFKGLMVQAVDENTNQPIGSFEGGRGLKLIDSCSAVTHSDNRGKRSATLVWNAPRGASSGRVAFKGTVVQRFSEFWTGLQSDVNPNI